MQKAKLLLVVAALLHAGEAASALSEPCPRGVPSYGGRSQAELLGLKYNFPKLQTNTNISINFFFLFFSSFFSLTLIMTLEDHRITA